jgi:hypothetical protein
MDVDSFNLESNNVPDFLPTRSTTARRIEVAIGTEDY